MAHPPGKLQSKAIAALRYLKDRKELKKYKDMDSNEQRFNEIYSKAFWQNKTDSASMSGDGSTGNWLEESVNFILNKYKDNLSKKTIVEIGCGDFNFGAKISPFTYKYIGIDVSEQIINHNLVEKGPSYNNVEFIQMDCTETPPPVGDIYIVRQVLQHLTNDMVGAILNFLEQMPPADIFIFEDVPSDSFDANIDLPTAGPFTRRRYQSGIDPTKAPFYKSYSIAASWPHNDKEKNRGSLVCYTNN